MMLQHENVLITGGTKGLGRAIAVALAAAAAKVTVIGRNKTALDAMKETKIDAVVGDVTDKIFMDQIIAEVNPSILILNAGATPAMAPINEMDWESFSAVWNIDTKAGLFGIQAALKTPMPNGSRVFIISSGAALGGSSLSGGYAGAKRMLWFMAKYANEVSTQRSLGIQFQVIVPTQIIGETDFGFHSAKAIAKGRNMKVEDYLKGAYGKPFTAKEYAAYFVKIITDKLYGDGLAYGIKYDGISKLE